MKDILSCSAFFLRLALPTHRDPKRRPLPLMIVAEYLDTLASLVREHAEAGATEEEIDSLPMPELYENWWYGRFFVPNLHALYQKVEGTTETAR